MRPPRLKLWMLLVAVAGVCVVTAATRHHFLRRFDILQRQAGRLDQRLAAIHSARTKQAALARERALSGRIDFAIQQTLASKRKPDPFFNARFELAEGVAKAVRLAQQRNKLAADSPSSEPESETSKPDP